MLLNFDYDGVLADSLEMLLTISQAAQINLGAGRPPNEHDFATIENLTYEDLGVLIGVPASSAVRYKEEVLAIQQKSVSYPDLFPGIVSVFNELARSHLITIITSSQSAWVESALEHHGLRSAISQVYGGELGMTKSERILRAQAIYGFGPNQTFMFGDAISDIRQGKVAGVETGAILWGFQDRGLLKAENPDFMLETPEDLLSTVAG